MPTVTPDLSLFSTWQTYIVGLTIFMIAFGIRLLVQSLWKNWKTNKFYNEFVLHMLPILVGASIGAVARKFPWPPVLGGVLSARMMYGAALGLFCGFLYGRVRGLFGKDDASAAVSNAAPVAPPAATDVVPPPPPADGTGS